MSLQRCRHHVHRSRLALENAWIESFNGRLRDELLNGWQFDSLLEAQVLIEDWRIDYNERRPHSAHGELTPSEFAKGWTTRYSTSTRIVPGPLTGDLSTGHDWRTVKKYLSSDAALPLVMKNASGDRRPNLDHGRAGHTEATLRFFIASSWRPREPCRPARSRLWLTEESEA